MKTNLKIIMKCGLLILFLYITPFAAGLKETMDKTVLKNFLYHTPNIEEEMKWKQHLNAMSETVKFSIANDDFTFKTTKDHPISVPEVPTEEQQNKKRIYIYNTHQSEAYEEKETVMDAAALLGDQLQKKGFDVVLETNSISAYAIELGYTYDQYYLVSNQFLNDALVNYGGFDLIIDLHRDSIPKEASYYEENGVRYAKMMFVVGGLGNHVNEITANSTTLTDIMNQSHNGIMRNVMTKEAYYNQNVHQNMVLIELGGDVNPFDEVKQSIQVLAEGIEQFLG